MKVRDCLRALADNGFVEMRVRGSHHVWQGTVDGRVRVVVIPFAQPGDEIQPGTLASIIRQSGLARSLFR